MADCGTITINCPEITCEADIQAAWTTFCTEMQTAVDQLKACIESYELPECDITVMKDDLVDDPLSCNMIDFEGIIYGAVGAVCQLPRPSAGEEFRTGSDVTDFPMNEAYGWQSKAVAFATPFTTGCYNVDITITHADTIIGTSGPHVGRFYEPVVQEDTITANGFTVWFKSDDTTLIKYVTFRYDAIGY